MESMAQFNSIDEVYITKLQYRIDDIYIDQGLEGEIGVFVDDLDQEYSMT